MSIGVFVAVAVGIVLVTAGIVIAALLSQRRGRRPCAGCGRNFLAGWTQCMFCGWRPEAGTAKLEFVAGPQVGQVVPLGDDVTTLGSDAGNTVVLADPAVSRKHVGIRRVGDRYELADLGSTNGVYVNGHRMAKKFLAAGDIFRIGNTEMVFRDK